MDSQSLKCNETIDEIFSERKTPTMNIQLLAFRCVFCTRHVHDALLCKYCRAGLNPVASGITTEKSLLTRIDSFLQTYENHLHQRYDSDIRRIKCEKAFYGFFN